MELAEKIMAGNSWIRCMGFLVVALLVAPAANGQAGNVALPAGSMTWQRSTPTVIADDAKRAGRRKQAVHEEAVNSPPPDSTRKCGGQIYLNNWSFRHPPIGSKDFREMAMAMGHGAREATPNALN
jgi:hypothetical protein